MVAADASGVGGAAGGPAELRGRVARAALAGARLGSHSEDHAWKGPARFNDRSVREEAEMIQHGLKWPRNLFSKARASPLIAMPRHFTIPTDKHIPISLWSYQLEPST